MRLKCYKEILFNIYMSDKIYCNIIIHKELSDEYVICPFCYKQISEGKMKKSVLDCCEKTRYYKR